MITRAVRRLPVVRAAATLFFLALAACGPHGNGGLALQSSAIRAKDLATLQQIKGGTLKIACTADTDCPVGSNCGTAKLCTLTCIYDSDCASGQSCDQVGKCVNGSPAEVTCVRDVSKLPGAGKIACIDDSTCNATLSGTYCDPLGAVCTYDCDGVNKKCAAGLQCDCSGKCVSPTTPAPPKGPPPPSLTMSPTAITLPASSTTWQPIDLRLSTTDPKYAATTPPPVNVSIQVLRPVGLLTGSPPSATGPNAIEVSCAVNPAVATFSSSCPLAPSWTFSPVGKEYHASQRVLVRRNAALALPTSEQVWELAVLSADVDDHHQTVSVAVEPAVPAQHDGAYAGTLTINDTPTSLTPGDMGVGVTIAVTGWAKNGTVYIADSTGALPPPGIVRTGADFFATAFAAGWLGYNQHIHTNGVSWSDNHVSGSFTVTEPSPQARSYSWAFDLSRTGDLTQTACTNTYASGCPSGQTCDVVGGLCLPGGPIAPPNGYSIANYGTYAAMDTIESAALSRVNAAANQLGTNVYTNRQTEDGFHLIIPIPFPIHFNSEKAETADSALAERAQAEAAPSAQLAAPALKINPIPIPIHFPIFFTNNVYTDQRSNNSGFDQVYDEIGLDLMMRKGQQPTDWGYRLCKEQFAPFFSSLRSYNPVMRSNQAVPANASIALMYEPPGGSHSMTDLIRFDLNADNLCDTIYGSLSPSTIPGPAVPVQTVRNGYMPCTVNKVFHQTSTGADGSRGGYYTLDRYLANGYDTSCQSMYKRSVGGWGNADSYDTDFSKPTYTTVGNSTSIHYGPMYDWLGTSCYPMVPYNMRVHTGITGTAIYNQQNNVDYVTPGAFIAEYTDTNQYLYTKATANGTYVDALEVWVCPANDALMGPYKSYEAAGRFSCYGQPNGGALSLDSWRQHGPAMPVSGDPRCGDASGPVPSAVELFHLRDANANALASETQSNLFYECLADLERDPTTLASFTDFFTARPCISKERLFPALDELVADGSQQALVARYLQEWIGVHAFVAAQGQDEVALEAVLQTQTNPLTWDRVLNQADDALTLQLDNRVISTLKQNAGALRSAIETNALYYDKTQTIEQTMIDGLTVTLQTLTAYAKAERLASYAECRTGGASATRDTAMGRITSMSRRIDATAQLAYELYETATSTANGGAVTWASDFAKQVDAYRTARSQLAQAALALNACTNPFGISEGYVPLFFVDPTGTNSKYFASSDYMLEQARQLLSTSADALTAVQNAWTSERNSLFQQAQAQTGVDTRVDDAKSAAGRTIAALCGLGTDVAPDSVLSSFDTGVLTLDNCYIDTSIQGCGDPNFADRPANCYRGTVGEAAAAIISAQIDVDLARDNWTDLQAKFDLRGQQCDALQKQLVTGDASDDKLIAQHSIEMTSLREAKLEAEQEASALSAMSSAISSAVGSYGMSILGTGPSVAAQWDLQSLQSKMEQADADYAAEMQYRANDERVTSCFNEVDMLKIGISTAEKTIDLRSSDYLAAVGRFNTQAQALRYALADGRNTVWREQNRSFPPIAFHYWKHDKSVTYQLEFETARKVAYLTLLAMEYDYQQSLNGRSEILNATNPTQLQAVVGLPGVVGTGVNAGMLGGFSRQVDGQQRPSQDPVLVSLRSLLGISGVDPNTGIDGQQRLVEMLTSSSAAVYDDVSGAYLGQAVHFSLGPDNVPLQGRCAERIWRVAASPEATKPTSDNYINLTMEKSRTFGSRWCTKDGLQMGNTRNEASLLMTGGHTKAKTSALLHSLFNQSAQDMELKLPETQDFPNSDGELALMGLYGDYTLIFNADQLARFTLGSVSDVLLRFDVLTVASSSESN